MSAAVDWALGRDRAGRRLTRACSRRAGGVPGSARAQRPVRTLRNEGLCGHEPDRPQLMRMSLDGSTDDWSWMGHCRGWTAVVAAWALALPTSATAQSVCRPPDSTAARFLAHIARHASATTGADAQVRDSLRLQPTPTDQVVLVQNEGVCRQAAAAYRRELTTAAEAHTGRVYVVRAGDRFAVLDINYHIAPPRPAHAADGPIWRGAPRGRLPPMAPLRKRRFVRARA
jgi:hypothetical protein